MAYQNFFTESHKSGRASHSMMSGKDLSTEYRVRSEGDSVQVVKIESIEIPGKVLETHVVVTDPMTGEILFDKYLNSNK